MQTDRQDVIRLAHGRWPNILIHFGIEEKAVSGKHSPCPMCKGKDRFRLIDSNANARWICNQCGSGDGMDLLEAILGCDFKKAAERLRPIVAGFPMAPPQKGPDKQEKERRMKKMIEMWKAGIADHPMLKTYLSSRGLLDTVYRGADIRLLPELELYDDDKNVIGKYPVMLTRISDRNGKLAAMHRTYLIMNEQAESFKTVKKITPPCRPWDGGSIKLFNTKDQKRLIVGEGIETVLSVRAKIMAEHGLIIPCWAGVSANNLEKIAIPTHITSIMIAGDNDLSFTGQKAAYTLANRLKVHDKRDKVQVVIPEVAGHDFNDEINGE